MIHSLKNRSDLIKISCTQEAFNVHLNKNRAHLRRIQQQCIFPGGAVIINLPAMQETQKMQVRSLGQEGPLEEETATHSSILSWRIPWTEEPAGCSPWGYKESDTTEQLNTHTAVLTEVQTLFYFTLQGFRLSQPPFLHPCLLLLVFLI